jgi:mannose-6-phosphate isomerase
MIHKKESHFRKLLYVIIVMEDQYMQQVLKLIPIFKERIWGGKKLKAVFNYDIPSERTGECWGISGHTHGSSMIENGPLKGRLLADVFKTEKHLFNDMKGEDFPLLVKILDANNDLSVQVHPNDLYAKRNDNDLGKTECWYILDCKENASIIYGHTAHSKKDFIKKIQDDAWDSLLNRVSISKGDFYYVPAGTVHALCEGTLILEVQQSSDTTYRLFDYHRKDNDGNLRPLHIEKALDVITFPHENYLTSKTAIEYENVSIIEFVKEKYFTVSKWEVKGSFEFKHDTFHLMNVIEGEGLINNVYVKKGDHLIVTSAATSIIVEGHFHLIVSHP